MRIEVIPNKSWIFPLITSINHYNFFYNLLLYKHVYSLLIETQFIRHVRKSLFQGLTRVHYSQCTVSFKWWTVWVLSLFNEFLLCFVSTEYGPSHIYFIISPRSSSVKKMMSPLHSVFSSATLAVLILLPHAIQLMHSRINTHYFIFNASLLLIQAPAWCI